MNIVDLFCKWEVVTQTARYTAAVSNTWTDGTWKFVGVYGTFGEAEEAAMASFEKERQHSGIWWDFVYTTATLR